MTRIESGLRLTPHEALARDLIIERCSAPRRTIRASSSGTTPVQRRAALLLRSLADRLDHGPEHGPEYGPVDGSVMETCLAPRVASGPTALEPAAPARAHRGVPRPWSPAPRPTPHRHT